MLQRLQEHLLELKQPLSTLLEQQRQKSGLPRLGLALGEGSNDYQVWHRTAYMWKDECVK